MRRWRAHHNHKPSDTKRDRSPLGGSPARRAGRGVEAWSRQRSDPLRLASRGTGETVRNQTRVRLRRRDGLGPLVPLRGRQRILRLASLGTSPCGGGKEESNAYSPARATAFASCTTVSSYESVPLSNIRCSASYTSRIAAWYTVQRASCSSSTNTPYPS